MSHWTPVVDSATSLSPGIQQLLDEHWVPLQDSYGSRSKRRDLEQSLGRALQQGKHIPTLRTWLSNCLKMNTEHYPIGDLMSIFFEVEFLIRSQQQDSALRALIKVRKNLDEMEFGNNGVQQTQHNVLHYLAGYPSDEEFDDDDFDVIVTGADITGTERPETPVNTVSISPSGSPDHKRQKTVHTSISFEEFTKHRVTARGSSQFNQILAENHSFWPQKCAAWTQELNEAYFQRDDTLSDYDTNFIYDSIITLLRECRQVNKNIYAHALWQQSVRDSGLAKAIHNWTDPSLICAKAQFIALLIRKASISESIGIVLMSWTPRKQLKDQTLLDNVLTVQTSDRINDANGLFNAIKNNPEIIPRQALPSSIFFMLNLTNFQKAISMWLIHTLKSHGYSLNCANSLEEVEKLFRELHERVAQLEQSNQLDNIQSGILVEILKRTRQFRNLRNSVKKDGIHSQCKECMELPKEQHCIQTLLVKCKKIDGKYLGCGVSRVPEGCYMEPIPIPHSDDSTMHKPIITPDKLNLRGISYDNNIIDRCGRHVFLFADEDDPETVIDFWAYNFAKTTTLATLQSHHSHFNTVKNLARGRQFASYSAGSMYGKGARAPTGGAPGDGYTYYTGMEAVSKNDINALFNDAEDSMVMTESARILCPQVYKPLLALTQQAQGLGITGTNIYSCNNYTSPLHCDNDVSHGLCAQIHLQAFSEHWEFAFIYAEYGVYMKPRANSLWSFNSGEVHGTMLPADPEKLPLQDKHCTIGTAAHGDPPRVSNGKHVTAPKRNIQAANKYADVRDMRGKIGQYWNVSS